MIYKVTGNKIELIHSSVPDLDKKSYNVDDLYEEHLWWHPLIKVNHYFTKLGKILYK